MAQDGHRCGHVVTFASVKNETAVYISHIFDTLKLTNPEACSNIIGVVITDKDFVEQQTVAAGLLRVSVPSASFMSYGRSIVNVALYSTPLFTHRT